MYITVLFQYVKKKFNIIQFDIIVGGTKVETEKNISIYVYTDVWKVPEHRKD